MINPTTILLFLIDNTQKIILYSLGAIILYYWIYIIIKNPFRDICKYNYHKYHSKEITLNILNNIKDMNSREFEEFIATLLSKTKQYKSINLTSPTNDEGKDIILEDYDNNTIYVECKRYIDSSIGREICQKLIGSMVSDGVNKGLIVTSGSIHQNAWDYIYKLQKNQENITLNILDINDIRDMIINIENKEQKEKIHHNNVPIKN